jgi:hypothetical protein
MGRFDTAALRRASGEAGELKERLGQHGDIADQATKQAGQQLAGKDFNLGKAMSDTAVTWWFQVNTLYKSCEALEEYLEAVAKNDETNEAESKKRLDEFTKRFQ